MSICNASVLSNWEEWHPSIYWLLYFQDMGIVFISLYLVQFEPITFKWRVWLGLNCPVEAVTFFLFFLFHSIWILNHCQMLNACLSKKEKYSPTYSQALRLRKTGSTSLFQNLFRLCGLNPRWQQLGHLTVQSLSALDKRCHSWNGHCLIAPCSWDLFKQNSGQIAAF